MTQQRISPCVTVGPEITQVPQWATVQDHYSDKGLAQRLTCCMDDEQRPRKGMTNDKLVCQWQLEGFFFFFTPRQASWVHYTGQVWLLKQDHGSMWLLGHKSRHALAWFKSEHMRNRQVSPYFSVRGITMIAMLGWDTPAQQQASSNSNRNKNKNKSTWSYGSFTSVTS